MVSRSQWLLLQSRPWRLSSHPHRQTSRKTEPSNKKMRGRQSQSGPEFRWTHRWKRVQKASGHSSFTYRLTTIRELSFCWHTIYVDASRLPSFTEFYRVFTTALVVWTVSMKKKNVVTMKKIVQRPVVTHLLLTDWLRFVSWAFAGTRST